MRPDRPDALAGKVASALDRLARARRVHRQALATDHSVSPLQIELLTVLAGGPPPVALVGHLASEVGVAQPTATDSLRSLERKGLVERDHDETDARRTRYRLTAAGRRLAAELGDADSELIGAVAALPAVTQAVTLETLLTLIAQLVDIGTITVDRTCLTCRYHEHHGTGHHCTLLRSDLAPADLRVNCPEHQTARPVEPTSRRA